MSALPPGTGALGGSRRLLIAAAGALLMLTGCEPPAPPPVSHPQWVIHSKVSFVEADLATPREPLPLNAFRLSFSYVAGHLSGNPSIADFLHPQINPDYSFTIDLNNAATHDDLVRALQPTDFSSEPNLRIDPEDARIARLLPQALKPETDSIEQVASTDWVDAKSHAPLMLLYFDRPARITGSTVRNARPNRYNIRAGDAGYVWIGCTVTEEGEILFREVPHPDHVLLALAPLRPDKGGKGDGGACEALPAPAPPAPPVQSHESAAPAPGAAHGAAGTTASTVDVRGAESPRQAAARERVGGTPQR